MELNTRLDRDRFTWMSRDLTSADRASLLVEVTAPALPQPVTTVATNLVVVLDRSGSMGGGRLAHAQQALCDIVDKLTPHDTFGLVTFDTRVELPVPAGQVRNPEAIKRAIRGVTPRGGTDLASGLVRGLKEARRLEAETGVRVLLVSDGHANSGVTDPVVLGNRTGEYVPHRITTSTLGMGLGYDERLLGTIARQGSGNEHFAEEADTAAGAIGAECGELLGQRFLAVRLSVTCGHGVEGVKVLNEYAAHPINDGIALELGTFAPEQTKSVVLQFGAKTAPKPGRRKIATVRVAWVLADDLSDQSTQMTVWAKIAGSSDKPARIDRDVAAEVIFQVVQRRKRHASEALMHGDVEAAKHRYQQALRSLQKHLPKVPAERRHEFEHDITFVKDALLRLERDTHEDRLFVGKAMSANLTAMSRTRDRRRSS